VSVGVRHCQTVKLGVIDVSVALPGAHDSTLDKASQAHVAGVAGSS